MTARTEHTPVTTIDAALRRARTILDHALAHLADQTLVSGKVSTTALDRHQQVAYELAWSAAEITAADALVQRANAGDAPSPYRQRLAAAFAADTVHRFRGRLIACPSDYGLTTGVLATELFTAEVDELCSTQLCSTNLAALGAEAAEQGCSTDEAVFTDEQRMMRETFHRFANEVVEPLAEQIHRDDQVIPDAILGPLLELGVFGLSIPQRFGGWCSDEGEDNLGMILATEELSRGSLGAAGSLITRPEIVARALLAGGTDEQRAHWLPRLAAGDPLCAVAVTEPDYGSDVASMRFRATKVDGGWQLDGAKTWCTFGGKAGLLLVLARTEPDVELGHRGLSLLLVEKPVSDDHEFEFDQPGGGKLTGRSIATIGYRGMHSYELFFDNWFVGDDALIGGEGGRGKGFYYQMAGFAGGRIQTAARAVGVMQAAFDKARSYADERSVFGKPIAAYELTQVKLARMAMLLTASRELTYHVARQMDAGGGQIEASMVKLFASRAAETLTREAMQIHGGMGYAEETAVSRYFVDARVLSIFEGAEEILALRVVARSLIQLAAEAA